MGVGVGMGLGDDPFDSSNGFVDDFFNSNLEVELVIQLASPLFLASAEKEANDGEGFRKAAAPLLSLFSVGGGDGENDDATDSPGSEGRTKLSNSSSSSSRAGSSLPPISSSLTSSCLFFD